MSVDPTGVRIVFSIWELVSFVSGLILLMITIYFSRLIDTGDEKQVIDDLIKYVGLLALIVGINLFVSLMVF
jgi:hypothetical protein